MPIFGAKSRAARGCASKLACGRRIGPLGSYEFAEKYHKNGACCRADVGIGPYSALSVFYCILCSSAARRRLVQKISMACSSSSTGGRDGAMRMLESCGSRP